jgi:hypothetical protein
VSSNRKAKKRVGISKKIHTGRYWKKQENSMQRVTLYYLFYVNTLSEKNKKRD